MAWIESHQEVGRHPKTLDLASLLGVDIPAAIGYLHLLWWWALDYAQDGNLDRWRPEVIARGVGWTGDPQAFLSAMKDSGWVDQDGMIHDWWDYAGKLIKQRADKAERNKEKRAGNVPTSCRPRTDLVPDTYRERAHIPTQPTQQNIHNTTNSTNPTAPVDNSDGTPYVKRLGDLIEERFGERVPISEIQMLADQCEVHHIEWEAVEEAAQITAEQADTNPPRYFIKVLKGYIKDGKTRR